MLKTTTTALTCTRGKQEVTLSVLQEDAPPRAHSGAVTENGEGRPPPRQGLGGKHSHHRAWWPWIWEFCSESRTRVSVRNLLHSQGKGSSQLHSAESHQCCGPALGLPLFSFLSENCYCDFFLPQLHHCTPCGTGGEWGGTDEGLWWREGSDHLL